MNKFFWILTLVIIAFSVPITAADTTTAIRVDGMTCPFCVATSEKALQKIAGVKSVVTNLDEGLIEVCATDQSKLDDETLKKLFLDKGFTFVSSQVTVGCKK
jgi:mercuric ion binding protein